MSDDTPHPSPEQVFDTLRKKQGIPGGMRPEELAFLESVRAARIAGLGYGWMQQCIEIEWNHRIGHGAWGPMFYELDRRNIINRALDLLGEIEKVLGERPLDPKKTIGIGRVLRAFLESIALPAAEDAAGERVVCLVRGIAQIDRVAPASADGGDDGFRGRLHRRTFIDTLSRIGRDLAAREFLNEIEARAAEQVVCSRFGVDPGPIVRWAHVSILEALRRSRPVLTEIDYVVMHIEQRMRHKTVLARVDEILALPEIPYVAKSARRKRAS